MATPFFFNQSGVTWLIVSNLTNNVTGSFFLTILMIVFFILLLCIAMRLPVEASAILIMPFLLSVGAFYGDFVSVVGIALIYLGVLFAKNFFFQH